MPGREVDTDPNDKKAKNVSERNIVNRTMLRSSRRENSSTFTIEFLNFPVASGPGESTTNIPVSGEVFTSCLARKAPRRKGSCL